MTKVDGTDLIKILQSKFSSAGHLIVMNRCRNVILLPFQFGAFHFGARQF